MIPLLLTPEEMATIERLFNSVAGLDNNRALIPIHDKMIEAAKAASESKEEIL